MSTTQTITITDYLNIEDLMVKEDLLFSYHGESGNTLIEFSGKAIYTATAPQSGADQGLVDIKDVVIYKIEIWEEDMQMIVLDSEKEEISNWVFDALN